MGGGTPPFSRNMVGLFSITASANVSQTNLLWMRRGYDIPLATGAVGEAPALDSLSCQLAGVGNPSYRRR